MRYHFVRTSPSQLPVVTQITVTSGDAHQSWENELQSEKSNSGLSSRAKSRASRPGCPSSPFNLRTLDMTAFSRENIDKDVSGKEVFRGTFKNTISSPTCFEVGFELPWRGWFRRMVPAPTLEVRLSTFALAPADNSNDV